MLHAGIAASLFTVLCTGAASAEMTVYYRAGGWDAFQGPGDNGKPICGVGITNPADNRSFSLRFQIGGDTMTMQAKKPSWNIPEGTQMPVVMQIGLDTPWNLQGVGHGQVVEWALDRATVQSFDAQFRRATSMTLTYPAGNEAPWTVGLNGSTAISNALGRCVTDLTRRDQALSQQPASTTTSPAAEQTPTQPYSQANVQPSAPTPAPAPQQPAIAAAPTLPVSPAPSQPYATTGTPAVPR
jgi:hypothetical protein